MRSVGEVLLTDQLHQILLCAADDGPRVPPFAPRHLGIGGDQIVGLQIPPFAMQGNRRASRVADQRGVRAQITRGGNGRFALY